MLRSSCMGCCVCPSCSSFSHLRGLLSAPRALLKCLVVFSARHLQLNNVPPGTPATFCLYLPFNDGDKKLWRHGRLHTSPTRLAFYSFPHAVFQRRVLPLTGCTTSFPVWRRCWCLTTIGAFKTLSEGTSGRVVFLPCCSAGFSMQAKCSLSHQCRVALWVCEPRAEGDSEF